MSDEIFENRLSIPVQEDITVSACLSYVGIGKDPDRPSSGGDLLILAHGAGQDMDSPFVSAIADRLTVPGCNVLRFNFPYMDIARETGRRRPPDRAPKLEQTWRAVADHARALLAPRRLILGGKSMGARMASHIAADGYHCAGLLFLGYPLHPPGKPDKLRSEHLARINAPMLFMQGDRDRLCRLDKLEPIIEALPMATLHRIEGGDHSLKLLKRLGRSEDEVFDEVAACFERWLGEQNGRCPGSRRQAG
jgi:predicted alpha/beta-hydrolase family hydrolase